MKKDNSILIKLVFLASLLCSVGFITSCKQEVEIGITVKNNFSDIQVEQSITRSQIKFSVKDNYDIYEWYLDDKLVSKNPEYILILKDYPPDTYELYLETIKDGFYYSYFAHITVNK